MLPDTRVEERISLRKGDVLILDGRIVHKGLANHSASGIVQKMCFFTFTLPSISDGDALAYGERPLKRARVLSSGEGLDTRTCTDVPVANEVRHGGADESTQSANKMLDSQACKDVSFDKSAPEDDVEEEEGEDEEDSEADDEEEDEGDEEELLKIILAMKRARDLAKAKAIKPLVRASSTENQSQM